MCRFDRTTHVCHLACVRSNRRWLAREHRQVRGLDRVVVEQRERTHAHVHVQSASCRGFDTCARHCRHYCGDRAHVRVQSLRRSLVLAQESRTSGRIHTMITGITHTRTHNLIKLWYFFIHVIVYFCVYKRWFLFSLKKNNNIFVLLFFFVLFNVNIFVVHVIHLSQFTCHIMMMTFCLENFSLLSYIK